MKVLKEVIKDIEHIPKCPTSGEVNILYIIKEIYKNGKDKDNKT